MLGLHIIMPVIGATAFSIGVIVYLIISSKERIAKASAISHKSFEELAAELKQELADIKEKFSSMEKMMKDV
ncbi:MAG: hypothetical protein FWF81_11220 [Defluviitaleaceae bacterium]|nr:hypothetical protein [Defluviitaleaceae bacterium]